MNTTQSNIVFWGFAGRIRGESRNRETPAAFIIFCHLHADREN